ncbi:uncharacterized protein LOC116257184 [Nymphaea colorata]|nr:uncharacterized protein LOC116257184 [Nymphaea colorata]
MLEGGKYYRNEVPIKTITVDDGDIYDCMKLDSHPRKRNPSILRKIQSRGKPSLPGTVTTANDSVNELTRIRRRKAGAFTKVSCPPGSFPVLKATKAGPLNFSAIESFASLRARSFLKSKTTKPLVDDVSQPRREYATASVTGSYRGGEGTLSIWRPRLEDDSEMSISQIWVLNSTPNDFSMSLEAGWMVNPMLYGDRRTRFFAFTTNDDYNTVLYNDDYRAPPNNRLEFTRTDDYMPFGKQLDCSTIDGDNTELEIIIKQDEDQDWELWVDDTMIGFWPKSNYRKRYANKIVWGGEIVNERTRGRHTSTQMGNGHFSSEPIGRVAYTSNMAIYDLDLDCYDAPEEIDVYVPQPDCYDLEYYQSDDDDDYGQHITFGGPGYDRIKCP